MKKIAVICILAESRDFESFSLAANNNWLKLATNQWHTLPLGWRESALNFKRSADLQVSQYQVTVIDAEIEGVPVATVGA